MNHLRSVLAVIAGGAVGVLMAGIILGVGDRWGGICIAVAAACVLLRFLVKAVQEDKRINQLLRDDVWRRRDQAYLAALAEDFAGKWPDEETS
jgi:hypothetical protein